MSFQVTILILLATMTGISRAVKKSKTRLVDVTIYGETLNVPTTLVTFGIPAENHVIHHVSILVFLLMFKKACIKG